MLGTALRKTALAVFELNESRETARKVVLTSLS